VTLGRFPRRTLRGARTVVRVHRAALGPWWFSSDGSGRFDPTGAGHGTCSLAEQPLGAWIEVFRKHMLLAEEEVHARSLLSVALGRDLRLADLTSRRALAFGVTASLSTDADYAASRAFGDRALAAGFAGVRYWLRHDPAQRLYGIALFGPAGAPDPADPKWPPGADAPIDDELVDAARAFGYRVLPVP
jgi:hypothetical protein